MAIEPTEAEVEAAVEALMIAAQDEPNWSLERYRLIARAALTAAAQVRAQAQPIAGAPLQGGDCHPPYTHEEATRLLNAAQNSALGIRKGE